MKIYTIKKNNQIIKQNNKKNNLKIFNKIYRKNRDKKK